MTGPELDALIARAEDRVWRGFTPHNDDVLSLVSELKIYRAMALRLERCVHELVKENDKAQEELKDMDRQINLRLMATSAMEKATAMLDEAMEAKPCQP